MPGPNQFEQVKVGHGRSIRDQGRVLNGWPEITCKCRFSRVCLRREPNQSLLWDSKYTNFQRGHPCATYGSTIRHQGQTCSTALWSGLASSQVSETVTVVAKQRCEVRGQPQLIRIGMLCTW